LSRRGLDAGPVEPMKKCANLRGWATICCCLAIAVPRPAIAALAGGAPLAEAPGSGRGHTPVVTDVALHEGGVLVGQLFNTEGQSLAGIPVAVQYQGREIATTVADANGRFAVGGLRGGTVTLIAGDTSRAFRVWAPGTAPPAAGSVAMAVVGTRVVRGQCCPPCGGCRPIGGLLRNPWVIATLVGAAVAIPIALADDDDSAS